MLKVPYFNNIEVEISDTENINEKNAITAIDNFLALTEANRIADSYHIFAYYKDFHKDVGGEDWLDEEMGIPESPTDIWKYVKPNRMICIEKGYDGDDNWYITMEANCDWEEEHGLMLVWRNGTTLTKVGGYDGHLTNVNAFADDNMINVVYAASNPEYKTFLNSN